VTVNNPQLTAQMLPTLERVAGEQLAELPRITGAEDFSYFQREVPGVFIMLGITPREQVGKAPANHSPKFFVEESVLVTGVRAMANLAVDYLFAPRTVSAR
jgi:amidohydrolase